MRPQEMTNPALSRRGFLFSATAGAGLATFGFSGLHAADAADATGAAPEINAWVVIHADERVTIRIARAEMGQGSLTGLAQMVAEELDCDWDKVGYELVHPAQNHARANVWGAMATGGSQAIRGSHQYLRVGGATARAALVQAAAKKWNVAPESCTVSKGVVLHPDGKTQLSYGALVGSVAGQPVPQDVQLKDPKNWTIAGQPKARLDTRDKLTGAQKYGHDLTVKGQVIALPKACPVHGGKLVSFDAKAVLGLPGVKQVIQVDAETVAVIADGFWHAKQALDALPIVWDFAGHDKVDTDSITAHIKTGLTGPADLVNLAVGDTQTALAKATRKVEAEYAFPFINHAPMETLSALVIYKADSCEVWAPSQVAQAALKAIADTAGLPIEACTLHTMLIGGSFGRRLSTDYLQMAVKIAKQMPGVPVKMVWTREEDMAQGRFHPMTRCKLTASLTKDGKCEALHMRIAGQSIGAYVMPEVVAKNGDRGVFQGLLEKGAEGQLGYSIPNLTIDYAMRNTHIRPGYWRGVNLNQNAVYLECFLDEVAHAAGRDPLDLRRELMANHPRHLAVLEAVAQGIGWGRKMPQGHGLGLAQIMGFGSYVAAAAEVSVIDGKLKMHKIVASTNPGFVINPQQAEAQIAGSFSYGLGAMLHGGNTVEAGRIAETNFDGFGVMTLADMPDVEVLLRPTGDFWGGIGEPTIAVAAPAVMNAIFAATGKRVREFPIRL